MDGGLKQRLVGALVLVGLAVIFVPSLLDNQRDDGPIASRIPAEPAESEVREIPLNVEEAHEQVVKEQQALIAQARPVDTGSGEVASEQETLPSEAAAPEPMPEPPVPESAAARVPPGVETGKTEPAVETNPTLAKAAEAAKAQGRDAIGAFLESAWVVQAGVFGNEANARNLAGKLKASGFKAFTRKTPQGMRVFVGPELDRGKAQAMMPKIQQITQVKPMIVAFDPLQH